MALKVARRFQTTPNIAMDTAFIEFARKLNGRQILAFMAKFLELLELSEGGSYGEVDAKQLLASTRAQEPVARGTLDSSGTSVSVASDQGGEEVRLKTAEDAAAEAARGAGSRSNEQFLAEFISRLQLHSENAWDPEYAERTAALKKQFNYFRVAGLVNMGSGTTIDALLSRAERKAKAAEATRAAMTNQEGLLPPPSVLKF